MKEVPPRNKQMNQRQFDSRIRAIRASAKEGGFRLPREQSPEQTVISVDREVYEFVRRQADKTRRSLRATLTEIMRPLMGKEGERNG